MNTRKTMLNNVLRNVQSHNKKLELTKKNNIPDAIIDSKSKEKSSKK